MTQPGQDKVYICYHGKPCDWVNNLLSHRDSLLGLVACNRQPNQFYCITEERTTTDICTESGHVTRPQMRMLDANPTLISEILKILRGQFTLF